MGLMVTSKYFTLYNKIIDNAISMNRSKQDESYYEAHHIVPISVRPDLKKDENNTVLLTGREHYLCHWLLTKFLVGSQKGSMVHAFNMMSTTKQSGHFNSILYEKNRIARAELLSKNTGVKAPMFGKKHSEATKLRMKKSHTGLHAGERNHMFGLKGDKNPNFGRIADSECRNNISKAKTGKCQGSKNSNAKIILIYDNNNELQHSCNGNFKKVCDEYNLPQNALGLSYQSNGEPIHNNTNRHNFLKSMGITIRQGWYALLEKQITQHKEK